MRAQLVFIITFFLSVVSAEESLESKLKLVCKNKSVDLTRSAEVKAIIKALEANPAYTGCSKEVRESFLALSQVIDVNEAPVCSMSKVKQLRDYHFRFVSTATTGHPVIPKSLRKFVIGFGLIVSKQCKKLMINSLLLDSQQVSADDYKVLEPWFGNEEGLMGMLGDGSTDFDDLLSIRSLLKITGSTDNEKVFVHSSAGEMLARVQSVCNRKFKPFYEKLILPLVELSNFGYNYQGEELQRELAELTTNQQVQLWYKITYLCESLSDIDLIMESKDAIETEGINRKLVRILTREEAEDFEKSGGVSLTESNKDVEDAIVYNPENGNPIGDEIIDHSDKDMEKLINNFDSHVTEKDKVRVRLFQKLINLMKQILLRGKINLVFGIIRRFGKQSGLKDRPVSNKDLVDVIDSYVRQATENSLDHPVGNSLKGFKESAHNQAKFESWMKEKGIDSNVPDAIDVPMITWRDIVTVVAVCMTIMLFVSVFTG